ncbi:MAG: KH domain-containing protein [Desulfobacteraceae bacterium]|nr:KH domain-containing protein [Desulfobacteraceae bacterium]
MPKTMEFTAKSIEKALELAGQKLDMNPDDIKHDIISYGSSGIFGLVGVKKAKIRVFIKPGDNKEKRSAPPTENLKDMQPREHAKNLVAAAFQDTEYQPKAKEETIEDKSEPVDDEIVAFGKQVVETIVKKISENASVSVQRHKDKIIYNVEGGQNAVLIGKRGHTLEAIQYLVEKIVNKKNAKRIRVLVDVEGYLDTRRENLVKLATRSAQKAKRVGKPMTLGQMNAHDRRIVHLHLKKDNGVRTQSIGEGYYRRLMIFPKKRKKTKN